MTGHGGEIDPRSGLPLLDHIPEEFASFGLSDAVLHWIGHLAVYDSRWVPQRRVGLISDSCLYCCDRGSKVTHCVRVGRCDELLLCDAPTNGLPALGLRAWRADDDSPTPDVLIGFPAGDTERSRVIGLLRALHRHHTGHPELPVLQADHEIARMMSLTLPPTRTLMIEPIMSRTRLWEEQRLAHGHPRYDAGGLNDAAPLRSMDGAESELVRTRSELRRTKRALKQALQDQTDEIEAIRDEFLTYDREIVEYLNGVFSRFPQARTVFGAPPTLHRESFPAAHAAAPRSPTGAHDMDHGGYDHEQLLLRGLAAENAALRRRLRQVEQQQQEGAHSPQRYPSPVRWLPARPLPGDATSAGSAGAGNAGRRPCAARRDVAGYPAESRPKAPMGRYRLADQPGW